MNSVVFTDSMPPKGFVSRDFLIDGNKFKALVEKKTGLNFDSCYIEGQPGKIDADALMLMVFDSGLSKEEINLLINKCRKVMFAENRLWRFIRNKYNKDIQIPYLTGKYTKQAISRNLVVNVGHKIAADRIGGTSAQGAVTGMAIGTGSTSPVGANTALETEVSRGAATVTNTTTTITGDTEQFVRSFTAGGAQTITEEGLFDDNTSGGKMLARQTFAGIPMQTNDILQLTHKVVI